MLVNQATDDSRTHEAQCDSVADKDKHTDRQRDRQTDRERGTDCVAVWC